MVPDPQESRQVAVGGVLEILPQFHDEVWKKDAFSELEPCAKPGGIIRSRKLPTTMDNSKLTIRH